MYLEHRKIGKRLLTYNWDSLIVFSDTVSQIAFPKLWAMSTRVVGPTLLILVLPYLIGRAQQPPLGYSGLATHSIGLHGLQNSPQKQHLVCGCDSAQKVNRIASRKSLGTTAIRYGTTKRSIAS